MELRFEGDEGWFVLQLLFWMEKNRGQTNMDTECDRRFVEKDP